MNTVAHLGGPGEDDDLLRRAFDEVLRPSFHADELPSWDYLLSGFEAPHHQLVSVAVGTDVGASASVLGVAVTNWDETSTTGTLSYLATSPHLRSRGVGAKLLEELAPRWSRAGLGLLLAEVHDPRVHPVSPDERPLDRLRFYDRAGARLVGVPWIQPALSVETHRSRGMLLIALPPAPDSVASEVLLEWTRDYFVDCEGAVPEDAEYAALVEIMGSRPTWQLQPMTGYDGVPLL